MKFCGTPPLNLLFGLEAALGLLFEEGLPAIWRRHSQLAAAMVLGAIAGVEAALHTQGIPVGGGGVQHAVRALAEGTST